MRFLLIGLMALTLFSSCRGNDSNDSTGAVQSALEAFSQSFRSVAAALTVASEQGTAPGEITKFNHVLLCDSEGSSSIEETISDNTTDGTFLVEADLDECAGVQGEVSALGSFARSADGVLYDWAYEGVLKSGDCDVDVSDLEISSFLQTVPALSLVSGTLTAECLGDTAPITVVCRWSQTPVLSQEALLAGCN